MEFVTKGIKSAGVLDYVAGWYIKAGHYLTGSKIGSISRDRHQFSDAEFSNLAVKTGIEDMFASADKLETNQRRQVKCAFVSTNSITQGEQVGVLWSYLLAQGMHIQFAHRTFQWSNEAPGKAAVHCVIIGFGYDDAKQKHLFEYADIKGHPHEITAQNINPYLVDAPDTVLPNRRDPLCNVSPIVFGSMPNDGGNLLLSDVEKDELIKLEPAAKDWIKPFVGAEEFINKLSRWCLWLVDCPPSQLKAMPHVLKRVEAVRLARAASNRKTTQDLAATPTLFGEIRQPASAYLLIPRVSSERRPFIPVGFLEPAQIASDATLVVPNATLYHFGILTSTMHNAWMRQVCGRLESRYRYSNTIVYNNFPWPTLTTNNHAVIEAAAQGVLDARALFPNESLATLYDPDTMPTALVKAHAALDKAIDAAYVADGGAKSYASDAERVAFLIKRYQQLTSLI